MRSLADWGSEILDACRDTAAILDRLHGGDTARRSVEGQRRRLEDPEQTPSARILARMRQREQPFFRVAMEASEAHAHRFRACELDPETVARLTAESSESLAEQARIEAADTVDFATYRRQFIEQPLLPLRQAESARG
jgi:glutamate--cysteine ligase